MRQNGVVAATGRSPEAGRGARRTQPHAGIRRSELRPLIVRDTPLGVRMSVFLTDLGWFGLAGSGTAVVSLTIGHTSADGVRSSRAEPFAEADWHPALRRRLEAFAAGELCNFDDVTVALPALTFFQERVIAEVRGVGYGQTRTYGQLAERAGAPRAARAVGTVMSTNRVPIIIPCHRVIASGGRLGGYSAPQGVDLKRRLLAMEAGLR